MNIETKGYNMTQTAVTEFMTCKQDTIYYSIQKIKNILEERTAAPFEKILAEYK
jgi:hypothetical protein